MKSPIYLVTFDWGTNEPDHGVETHICSKVDDAWELFQTFIKDEMNGHCSWVGDMAFDHGVIREGYTFRYALFQDYDEYLTITAEWSVYNTQDPAMYSKIKLETTVLDVGDETE